MRLLGHRNWPTDLQLDWLLPDGTIESFVGKPEWKHEFTQASAQLVTATLDGRALALAGEWSVSASAPRAEIEAFDPSEIVLDVRSAAEPEKRVEGTSLLLRPISERRADLDDPKAPLGGAGEAMQIQKSRENPLVVLPSATALAITVTSGGFEPLEFPDGLVPGLHRVELIPARRLLVNLRAVSGVSAPVEVGFRISGGKHTFDWRSIKLPGRLDFALGRAEKADLVVRLEPELGLGPELLRETVVLDPLKDTQRSFEVDLAVAETAGGTLRVELVESEHQDLDKALLKLQRSDVLLEEILTRKSSPSWLSRWPDDGVNGVVSREFRGLAAGQYQLTVEPLGLEQKVEIRAGETTFARLAAAELGTLQIAPVGSAGRLAMDQVPGSLWWRLDDEPENTAPVIDGQQIASGRARSAEILDTHWQVRAPVGARIIVQFMGPKVLGATPLRLTVQPGTTEATMSFAGL
ncbi:MAG: hypothetical protein NTV21_19920 [Planctomycetota bacterium]|nr:hypothetical protein [Planctomycetota bacterium]